MKTKILIILILPVVLASCNEKIVAYNDLTEAQLQLIPYEMGQVISFIDGAGQTVDLTVTRNELKWFRLSSGGLIEDYIEYRWKFVTLKGGYFKIELDLVADDDFPKKKVKSKYRYVNCSLTVNIGSGRSFYLTADPEGTFFNSYNSSMAFHDSMEINGKVYYNVVEQNKESKQLFYNKTYGILQFRNSGINELTLKD